MWSLIEKYRKVKRVGLEIKNEIISHPHIDVDLTASILEDCIQLSYNISLANTLFRELKLSFFQLKKLARRFHNIPVCLVYHKEKLTPKLKEKINKSLINTYKKLPDIIITKVIDYIEERLLRFEHRIPYNTFLTTIIELYELLEKKVGEYEEKLEKLLYEKPN